MKKILFICSMVAMAIMLSVTAFAFEGDGTAETPFLICDQAELELVTDFPDCHFKLLNDIELEGTWIPLCKQTSSGQFTGVFDGAGHTISNLVTDGSEGGLFKNNGGTIKNLEIIIASDGMTGSGAVADSNYGNISNCSVEGNVIASNLNVGGICAHNAKNISQCKFKGNIENTYSSGRSGGICGASSDSSTIEKCSAVGYMTGTYSAGGICGILAKSTKVSDCYFIGEIGVSTAKQGGIYGDEFNSAWTSSYSILKDCYAVSTFESGGGGIGYQSSYTSIIRCYYDKTISGITSTTNGTPKSTVAMKMKQTYSEWDFNTVWAIDKNINDGYPYLQFEYPDAVEGDPYTVNSVSITDLSGNELEEIPEESFYAEINITKNDNLKNADSLIIAIYDENGTFTDVKFLKGVYNQNQTVSFGAMINNSKGNVGCIKGFVWNNVSGVSPLSNVVEINK